MELTPGPEVRDAVLRRARVLRLRRQAAWTGVGGAAMAVVVLAGGAALRPTAGQPVDSLVPGPTTEAPPGTTPTPRPTASTATAGTCPEKSEATPRGART